MGALLPVVGADAPPPTRTLLKVGRKLTLSELKSRALTRERFITGILKAQTIIDRLSREIETGYVVEEQEV